MKTKIALIFTVLFLTSAYASAWNVFIKTGSEYRLRYSSLDNISFNGVAEKLGYGENFYYTYMEYNENKKQDIYCVLFKCFTSEIIGIITENNVTELYQRDIDSFLKEYDFDREFGVYKTEACLDKGIEEKNFTLPFIAETMELDCDTTQLNGEFISEKFKYNLYFLNGILIKYEPSDGYGKWAKDLQKRNPQYFEKLLSYAKQYWNDDENGIHKEINAQCNAFATTPNGIRNEHIDEFYENGIYNFKMLNVLYNDDTVTLRELKDLNHGKVSFMEEREAEDDYGKVMLYLYKTRNGIFGFDISGNLRYCRPL